MNKERTIMKKTVFFNVIVIMLFLNQGYLASQTVKPIPKVPFVFLHELELENQITDKATTVVQEQNRISYERYYKIILPYSNQLGAPGKRIMFVLTAIDKNADDFRFSLQLYDKDFERVSADLIIGKERNLKVFSISFTSKTVFPCDTGPYYLKVIERVESQASSYKLIALHDKTEPRRKINDFRHVEVIEGYSGSYEGIITIEDYDLINGGDNYNFKVDKSVNVFIYLDPPKDYGEGGFDDLLQFYVTKGVLGNAIHRVNYHPEVKDLSRFAIESDNPLNDRDNFIMTRLDPGEYELKINYHGRPYRKFYRKYTVHFAFLPCVLPKVKDKIFDWYYGGGSQLYASAIKDHKIQPNRDKIPPEWYWTNKKEYNYAYSALYFPKIALYDGDSVKILNDSGDVSYTLKSGMIRGWIFIRHTKGNQGKKEPFLTTILLDNKSGKSYYILTHKAFGWEKCDGGIDITIKSSLLNENSSSPPMIIPKKEMLSNAPNPFNPETDVAYEVFESGNVVLSVLNTKGKKVIELVNGNKAAGSHSVHWNGKDSRGKDMPSGVYYAVLEVNGKRFTKKMVMLK